MAKSDILRLIGVLLCTSLALALDTSSLHSPLTVVLYLFPALLFHKTVRIIPPFYYGVIVAALIFVPWGYNLPFEIASAKIKDLVDTSLMVRVTVFSLMMIVYSVTLRLATPATRSNAQLAALWNSIVDGLIVINDRAIIQSANPSATNMFGYSEEELIGQNVKMLMPSEYADHHDQFVGDYNRTGHAKIIGIGREVSGKRKSGKVFPLYLAVNKFQVGKDIYYGGIVRDQTAEKKVEAELVAAKEAAEASSKAKSSFLNSMSHEVRTPLNAILGFAQLIELDIEKRRHPEVHTNLQHIQRSGEHLLALLNDILDLASIETGQLKLEIARIDLGQTLSNCVAMVEPMSIKHSIHVENSGVLSGYYVYADSVRLTQAIMNLLTNAIKYNRIGGTVSVSINELPGHTLRLLVKDTGSGIPEKHQKNLFEPFNRLGREAMNIEGSGIGLSVTKSIMSSMGGKIGFHSKVGEGSDFWLDLPSASAENPQHPVLKTLTATPGTDIHKNLTEIDQQADPIELPVPASRPIKIKVLYVEDNASNVALMQSLINHYRDVELVTRTKAEEGVAYAIVHKPDLVLLDLNLPEMNGFEAFSMLQLDENTRSIPVIAVSADVRGHIIEQTHLMGFKGFISKPFKVEEVRKAIYGS